MWINLSDLTRKKEAMENRQTCSLNVVAGLFESLGGLSSGERHVHQHRDAALVRNETGFGKPEVKPEDKVIEPDRCSGVGQVPGVDRI